MILNCKEISKTFQSKQGSVNALQDISFTLEKQQFISFVGPSGCGKTTLLKVIAGLVEPTNGQVELNINHDHERPKTAMVFQEQGLFPWMTVLQNVGFGLEMRGVPLPERVQQAEAFICQVGLDGFSHHYPHELSGGMKQRVALARAFLTNPYLLLMDEPFGALDAQTRFVLQGELLRVWEQYKKTVVFVTHDIDEAVLLSDEVYVLSGRPGRILDVIKIPLPRPRNLLDYDHNLVQRLHTQIWELLEPDVKSALEMGL